MAEKTFDIGDEVFIWDSKAKKAKKVKIAGRRLDQEGNVLDYISEEREVVGEQELTVVEAEDKDGKPTKTKKIKQPILGENISYSKLTVSPTADKAEEANAVFEAELKKQKDEEAARAAKEAADREQDSKDRFISSDPLATILSEVRGISRRLEKVEQKVNGDTNDKKSSPPKTG